MVTGRWRTEATGLRQFETLVVVVGTPAPTLLGVEPAAAAEEVLGMPVTPALISRKTAALMTGSRDVACRRQSRVAGQASRDHRKPLFWNAIA